MVRIEIKESNCRPYIGGGGSVVTIFAVKWLYCVCIKANLFIAKTTAPAAGIFFLEDELKSFK